MIGQVEAERGDAVLVSADEFAVQVNLAGESDAFEFDKDLFAVGVVGQVGNVCDTTRCRSIGLLCLCETHRPRSTGGEV